MQKSKLQLKIQNDRDNNKILIIDKLDSEKKFIVKDGENKIFLIFLVNGKNHNGSVKIVIDGKKAKVQILGLIIGQRKQKIELYTLQDHLKPESVSDLLIKSVLFDESKFNYKGLIRIEKNAQKSNAYQKNQNLLMSPKSWADTKPNLEILANDVRCTHGATVGKIDKEQLYYLQTRGLDEISATILSLNGFFHEVIERIPDEKLREEINGKLDKKITNLLKHQNLSHSGERSDSRI